MKTLYSIGRDCECDIIISDDENIVSRRHATLRVTKGGKYYLSDQSMNGTYINGIRMRSGVEIPVRREDTISFAHVADLDWNMIPRPLNRVMILISSILLILLSLILVVVLSVHIGKSLCQSPSEPEQSAAGAAPKPLPANPSDTDSLKVPREELPSVKKPAPNGEVKKHASPDKIKKDPKKNSDESVVNPII